MRDRLPDELDALGQALERAAQRDVRRRRALERLRHGVVTVLIAVPLALAILTDDISPSVPRGDDVEIAVSVPPSWSFAVAHIPDELPPPSGARVCLDALDCTAPVEATVSFPAPESKP